MLRPPVIPQLKTEKRPERFPVVGAPQHVLGQQPPDECRIEQSLPLQLLFGQRLFPEPIQAWEKGPVVPSVYEEFKSHGAERLPRPDGFDVLSLDGKARAAIERAYADFGEVEARELSAQTHEEAPWRDTYDAARPNAEIAASAIRSYFVERLDLERSRSRER